MTAAPQGEQKPAYSPAGYHTGVSRPDAPQLSFPSEARLLRRLALIAALVAAAVNQGDLGSVDVSRRLQVARWLWAGEAQVVEAGQGIAGRQGRRQAPFGVGQSLVMTPPDMAASAILSAAGRVVALDARMQLQIRRVIVAFLMQAVISATAVLVAFLLLRELRFTPRESTAGALALLFGTTFLHYVQNAQENNLLLLCTLAGFWQSLRWLDAGAGRHAAAAGALLGLGLLTRLTAALDAVAVVGVVTYLVWRRGKTGPWLPDLWAFARAFVPPYLAFVLADRVYHWIRFGELLGTYWGVAAHQAQASGGAPAGWPFSTPFSTGFWGALFAPDASVFLFDPLLVLALAAAAWYWRRAPAEVRAIVVSGVLWLLAEICVHATWVTYRGQSAWGDRFLSVPVQVIALVGVPLVLRCRGSMGAMATALVAASVVVQLASTAVAVGVEEHQLRAGGSQFTIGQRFRNIAILAGGQAERSPMFRDVPREWRSWNYLPFLLEPRYPALSALGKAAWWLIVVLCAALALKPVTVHSIPGFSRTEIRD